MSDLNCITIVKEIEVEAAIELDLLDIIYDNVDTENDLLQVVDCVSDPIADSYKGTLREEWRENLFDNVNSVDDLLELISNISDSIVDEYTQGLQNASVDLIDLTCGANNNMVLDLLNCILNQHPKTLH